MINYQDNYILFESNDYFELAISSVIGNRDEQQDRSGYVISSNEGFVVICDGMGGHAGGKIASNLAVESLLEKYNLQVPIQNIQEFLLTSADFLDRKIVELSNDNGKKMEAGTTMSAVLVREKSMSWVSVGDSRIYIHRKNELVQVTKDHTYKLVLDEKKTNGTISEEYYQKELSHANALVSFLGVDGLPFIENNSTPLCLFSGDVIVIMSDGLYKLLTDNEIQNILQDDGTLNEMLESFENLAQKKSVLKHIKRDNMTVALIRIN